MRRRDLVDCPGTGQCMFGYPSSSGSTYRRCSDDLATTDLDNLPTELIVAGLEVIMGPDAQFDTIGCLATATCAHHHLHHH